jgi:hypothetical protein
VASGGRSWISPDGSDANALGNLNSPFANSDLRRA